MEAIWNKKIPGVARDATAGSNTGRGIFRLVFAFLLIVMLVGFAFPEHFLVSLSAGTVAVMMIPHLGMRQVDLFTPWNWLLYFSFTSIFLRGLYIAFDIPDEYTIKSIFLLREPKEFLIWPAIVVLLGVCFTTAGYLVGPTNPRKAPYRIFQSDQWNPTRLKVVLITLLVLSWVGFAFFIIATGGSLDDETLSASRGLSNNLSEYNAYGYLRWMVNLSDVAFYLIVAEMIQKQRIKIAGVITAVLAMATSSFYYFYVQNRSGILIIIINTLAILYYLRGKKFPLKEMLITAPIALLVFRWMTVLRRGSGYTGGEVVDLNLMRAFEPMIINNGGFDVSKTAHIMSSIGRQLDFQWGGTLLSVFTIWIPRQMWPGKPPNVDTMVGMAIYGAQTYGAGAVPPGLVGEMYWNFWLPGVIIGCFLAGYLLQFIYTQFKAYTTNRNIVLIYVTSFMQIGVALMGSGFSSALMSTLMSLLPFFIVLHFITQPKQFANQ